MTSLRYSSKHAPEGILDRHGGQIAICAESGGARLLGSIPEGELSILGLRISIVWLTPEDLRPIFPEILKEKSDRSADFPCQF